MGQMVPLGTLVDVREIGGPVFVTRYNLYDRRPDHRQLLPGVSTGEAIADIDRLAARDAAAVDEDRVDRADVHADPGGQHGDLRLRLAVVCVFLALAALYESWSLPLAVILVVPLCLLCSVAGVLLTTELGEHLRADRPGGAGRPGVQERDPDRRVRPRAARARAAAVRGHAGGLPAAAAADPDDLVRVHPRRRAAGHGHGRRGRDAAVAGHRGLQRHAGVTLFGIFLTPVFFYVIQGLGEMRIFSRAAAAAVGLARCCWAALARAAVGLPAGRRHGRGCSAPAMVGAERVAAAVPRRGSAAIARRGGRQGRPTAHRTGERPAEVTSRDLPLLHRSPDLRLGPVDRLRAGGRRGRVHAAGGPVSRRHAAHRAGHRLYPGANAQTVRDTVAAPIEEQVSGVEGMIYMSSQCTNDGIYTLTVTFKLGMDSDMAQVLVQNRVSLALPVIPALVQTRDQRQEDVAQHDDDRQPGLARRPVRRHLPEQLRDDLHQGRAGPAAGRRQHHLHRPARLQPARLARPRQAGGAGT